MDNEKCGIEVVRENDITGTISAVFQGSIEIMDKHERAISFLSVLKQYQPKHVEQSFTNINAIRRRKYRRLVRRLMRDPAYSPEACWEEMQRV